MRDIIKPVEYYVCVVCGKRQEEQRCCVGKVFFYACLRAEIIIACAQDRQQYHAGKQP